MERLRIALEVICAEVTKDTNYPELQEKSLLVAIANFVPENLATVVTSIIMGNTSRDKIALF